MRIRRATRSDISDLVCLLLEACADDPLHRLLEPWQSEYPSHTFAAVRRDKLLSDSYEVDVAVDDNRRVVGMAVWNCGAVRGTRLSWLSWGQLLVAGAYDRAVDFVYGPSRSMDFGLLHLLEDASNDMVKKYARNKNNHAKKAM